MTNTIGITQSIVVKQAILVHSVMYAQQLYCPRLAASSAGCEEKHS